MKKSGLTYEPYVAFILYFRKTNHACVVNDFKSRGPCYMPALWIEEAVEDRCHLTNKSLSFSNYDSRADKAFVVTE